MYLHIGQEVILNVKDIIGIFNLLEVEDKEKVEKMKQAFNVIDVSFGRKKSLILVEKNKEKIGYFSNISSATLAKRINLGKMEDKNGKI